MQIRLAFVSAAALALLFAAPAVAQQSRLADRDLSRQDMSFIKDAAAGGLAEVEFGKLAQQNGQSNEVKEFGARMVRDHGAANAELTAIATGKGMTMPDRLDAKHAQLRDRLARLRGSEFDRAYMREMVSDHDADIKAFQRELQAGHDTDIKRIAGTTLDVIRDHDRMAHRIETALTAVGSSRPPR